MARSVPRPRRRWTTVRPTGRPRDLAMAAGLAQGAVVRVHDDHLELVDAWPRGPEGPLTGAVVRTCRAAAVSGRAETWRRPSVLAAFQSLFAAGSPARLREVVTVPLPDGTLMVAAAPRDGVTLTSLEAAIGVDTPAARRALDGAPAVWATPARDPFLERLLADLVLSARRVLRARRAVLTVLDDAGAEVERVIVSDEGVDGYSTPEVPPGRGILAVLGDDPRPLRLRRVGDDLRVRTFPPDCGRDASFLGMALVDGERAHGALYVVDAARGAFGPPDEEVLALLASQALTAIDGVRTLRREHQRVEELESLQSAVSGVQDLLAGALAGGGDREHAMDALTARIRDLTGARCACVAVAEGGRLVVRATAGEGCDLLRGVESAVDLAEIAARVRAVMDAPVTAIPLTVGADTVGVLVAAGDGMGATAPRALLGAVRAQVAMVVAHEAVRAADQERQAATLALEVARARERAISEGYRRALAAQEAERARIARELHDEAGQVLAAVALHLRVMEARETDAAHRARLADLRQVVSDAGVNLHDLITHLRPPALRRHGLAAAVTQLVETLTGTGELHVGIDLDALPESLPEEEQVAVFRVVQEGLANVVRHSGARNASVTAARSGDRLRVVVEDDGRGFDPALVDGRYGIVGLRERLELLGGALTLDTTPGTGTALIAEIRLRPPA